MGRQVGKPEDVGAPPEADVYDEYEQDARAGRAMSRVGGSAITRTQTHYQTAVAVQQPRRLKSVTDRVLEEAAMIGEDFVYSFRVKNKDGSQGVIEGTSIDGAMILLRNWGNAALECELAEEGPTHWVFRATVIDLETGFTTSRLYRQRKGEKHGRFDVDRAMDIAFQIGQSKAQRNVILRAVPAWLISRAVDTAHLAAEKEIKNVPEAVAKTRAAFASLQVTDEQLLRRVGRPFDAWLPRDLVVMRATYRAIRDGVTSVAAEFADDDSAPAQSAPEPSPAPSPAAAASEPAPTRPDPTPTAAAKPAAAKPEPAPAAKPMREPGDD